MTLKVIQPKREDIFSTNGLRMDSEIKCPMCEKGIKRKRLYLVRLEPSSDILHILLPEDK